jgi:trigger factor
MEIKEILNEELLKKYNVVISAKEVAEEMERRAEKVATTANLDGFRKGKVPLMVIKSRYKDSLKAETFDHFINSIAQDLIKKNNFKMLAQPKVDTIKFEDNQDLNFELEIPLLPNIPKIDYKKIELSKHVTDVSEKELKEALEKFQKNQQTYEKLATKIAAKKGNAVLIDVVGSMGGKEFPEGKVDNKTLELGSGEFIPGFEDGLIGSKAGDTKTLNLAFPKDYWMKSYAGKKVSFKATVKEVSEIKVPKLDDELAKKVKLKDVKELKEKMQKSLRKHYEDNSAAVLKKDIFDYLDKNIKFTLPSQLLESEENFLSQNNPSKATQDNEVEQDNKKLAARRVKLALILSNIAEEEKIQLSQNDIKAEMIKHVNAAPAQAQQIIDYYQNNPEAAKGLESKIKEDKSTQFIIDNITLKEKKVTPEELIELFKVIK